MLIFVAAHDQQCTMWLSAETMCTAALLGSNQQIEDGPTCSGQTRSMVLLPRTCVAADVEEETRHRCPRYVSQLPLQKCPLQLGWSQCCFDAGTASVATHCRRQCLACLAFWTHAVYVVSCAWDAMFVALATFEQQQAGNVMRHLASISLWQRTLSV